MNFAGTPKYVCDAASKQETTTPKYNLDFIKKNTQYKTVAAYENSVKKSLLEKKQTQAESSAKKALWKKVIASSKVKKYPQQQQLFFHISTQITLN